MHRGGSLFGSLPPVQILMACAQEQDKGPFNTWYTFSDQPGDEGPILRIQETPQSIFPSWGHEGGTNLVLMTPTKERVITVRYREGIMESVDFDFSNAPSPFTVGMLVQTFLHLVQEHDVDLRTEQEKRQNGWEHEKYYTHPIMLSQEAPRHLHAKWFVREGMVECTLGHIVVQKEEGHPFIHASLTLAKQVSPSDTLVHTQTDGQEPSIRPW